VVSIDKPKLGEDGARLIVELVFGQVRSLGKIYDCVANTSAHGEGIDKAELTSSVSARMSRLPFPVLTTPLGQIAPHPLFSHI
jgi:hypothetical protein